VLERSTGLRNYAELGVALSASPSGRLILRESLFLRIRLLHDGAVFIRAGRVAGGAAASCPFPVAPRLGLGADGHAQPGGPRSERETDAVVLVVSEESGRIPSPWRVASSEPPSITTASPPLGRALLAGSRAASLRAVVVGARARLVRK
jgi:hypothetical protein